MKNGKTNKRNSVPKTKFKGRYSNMKVDFSEKTTTFKTLEGEIIRQNRLEILVVLKATDITGQPVQDVRQAVKILENNNVKFSDLFEEHGKEVTLKTVCVDLLNAPPKDDKKIDGNERYERFKLSERIHGADGEIEITSEKVSLVKKLIAESQYSNLILGQAYRWLESDEKEEKTAEPNAEK